MITTGDFQGEVKNLRLYVTPEGDVFGTGGSSEIVLGGGGIGMDRELQTSQWEAFNCMDAYQHLDEG